MPQTIRFDFPTALKAWADNSRGVSIPLGTGEAALIQRARRLSERLDNESTTKIGEELRTDPDAVELMHALRRVLELVGESPAAQLYNRVCRAYELTSFLSWEDDIGEHAEVCAQLALIAWRHCRRFRTYREASDWETRCVDETLVQGHIRDFLSLPVADLSDDLARRYFGDSNVVLALCRKLEEERNRDFNWVLAEANAVVETMERLQLPTTTEERAFLIANAAISACVASRHRGFLRSARVWIDRARRELLHVTGGQPYRAIVDFAELALWTDSHEFTAVRERFQFVRQELVDCGIDRYIAFADYLHGEILKAAGQPVEALSAYRRVVESPIATGDDLLRGLSLANIAEINSKLGNALDIASFRAAHRACEKHNAEWSSARIQASVGECLREQGQLRSAIESYRSSVELFRSLKMKGWAAYIQLLLAEALLADGQSLEATTEIAGALRSAEEEGTLTDIAAGIALLQKAVKQGAIIQKNDAGSLQAIQMLLKTRGV